MIQGNLFGWRENETPESRFDIHPRARKTNPSTSKEAAARVDEFAGQHYAKILQALETPLGKDGIARRTGLDKSQVSRRLAELQRLGKIELTGKEVKSDSGRKEREWKIK